MLSQEPSETSHEDEQQHNLAARALFSATEMSNPARLDTEFGRSLPQDNYEEYAQRYRMAFVQQVNRIAARLNRQNARKAQLNPRSNVARFLEHSVALRTSLLESRQ